MDRDSQKWSLKIKISHLSDSGCWKGFLPSKVSGLTVFRQLIFLEMQLANEEIWDFQDTHSTFTQVFEVQNLWQPWITLTRSTLNVFCWIISHHLTFLLLHRMIFTRYAWVQSFFTENLCGIILWNKELINPIQHMLILCPRRIQCSSSLIILKHLHFQNVLWALSLCWEFQFFLSFWMHWHFQALCCSRTLIAGNHLSSYLLSGVLETGNVRPQPYTLICHRASPSAHHCGIALL